jgi:hypothetical protein
MHDRFSRNVTGEGIGEKTTKTVLQSCHREAKESQDIEGVLVLNSFGFCLLRSISNLV